MALTAFPLNIQKTKPTIIMNSDVVTQNEKKNTKQRRSVTTNIYFSCVLGFNK